MRSVLFGAIAAIVIGATPARAQSDKPVHLIIGGGMVTPLGNVGDRFNAGGAFTIGLTFERSQPFGLQIEYGYNTLDGPQARIPLMINALATPTGTALIESRHRVHYFTASAMVHGDGQNRFNPYALAGGGMYHRSVSLTTPDVGFTTYCDPFWYVCYPTATEINRVIGERSTWNPGVNAGGGVAIRLGHAAAFYIEARWHFAWGPTFTTLTGEEQRANGEYFPVTFGFKF